MPCIIKLNCIGVHVPYSIVKSYTTATVTTAANIAVTSSVKQAKRVLLTLSLTTELKISRCVAHLCTILLQVRVVIELILGCEERFFEELPTGLCITIANQQCNRGDPSRVGGIEGEQISIISG